MKKVLAILTFSLLTSNIFAQNLFSFGNKQVSKQEFLYYFQKNNIDSASPKKALEKYIDLFIRFKLKVQAAYDLQMDTLQNIKTDIEAYKEQIRRNYMMDQDTLEYLIREAHTRLQEDIEIMQIFIAYRKEPISGDETTQAYSENEKKNAYEKSILIAEKISKGEKFETLALQYSDDPARNKNKGYVGFITAFTLPYFFENIIYKLKDNECSEPIKTNNGIYFFKRLNARKAAGKMQAAQILLALPENATNEEINNKKNIADSIYGFLLAGCSFDSLATIYSEDRSSVSSGRKMPEIEVGKYDRSFEENIFSLKYDGEISKVFKTDFGFHIIKRISHTPIEKIFSNAEQSIKEKILQDDRNEIAVKAFEKKVVEIAKAKKLNVNENNFILNHLTELNPEYDQHIKEFKEGNLLFEIMDKKIWGQAASDVIGLRKFYTNHINDYVWKESVKALIFTLPNYEIATKIKNEFIQEHSVENIQKYYSEIILLDSGRYEKSELLGVGKNNLKEGDLTNISINETDGSATFIAIIKKYKDPSNKSFEEARSSVINDYQEYLEARWINTLKKKYPVVVNQKTWNEIVKGLN